MGTNAAIKLAKNLNFCANPFVVKTITDWGGAHITDWGGTHNFF